MVRFGEILQTKCKNKTLHKALVIMKTKTYKKLELVNKCTLTNQK